MFEFVSQENALGQVGWYGRKKHYLFQRLVALTCYLMCNVLWFFLKNNYKCKVNLEPHSLAIKFDEILFSFFHSLFEMETSF